MKYLAFYGAEDSYIFAEMDIKQDGSNIPNQRGTILEIYFQNLPDYDNENQYKAGQIITVYEDEIFDKLDDAIKKFIKDVLP